jgi:ribosomal-protein-alanine N-acetyltransferase
LYVLGLAVAPEHRKQGIGRALMAAAKTVAQARRVQALWLDAYDSNAGAGLFYVGCDFRRVGPSRITPAPRVYYEWLAGGWS